MGLVPEFFVLLGITIFLAMSLLSSFLEDELPSRFQYLFQATGAAGLGVLLLSQGFASTTRFWISIFYLASALSSIVGLNVYLALVRRRMDIASTFSETVTVPTFMISALFVSSFLAGGGEPSSSPASISTLAILVLVASLSLFGLLREVSRHVVNTPGERRSPATGPAPLPSVGSGITPEMSLSSLLREEWEASPKAERARNRA